MNAEPVPSSDDRTVRKFHGAYGIRLTQAVVFIERDIDTVLEQLGKNDRADVVSSLSRYLADKAPTEPAPEHITS